MTTLIRQHTENGYYIVLEWDKANLYRVEVCPRYSDGMCGYPLIQRVYAPQQKRNAEAAFRRYVKQYCATQN